ncbi:MULTISPECIES: hypothetical protein [unclassified Pseudomonas]|uniref:hypothetical protein n=1 Tax=unclassified Pseudomonas TaxID=196821 RepID=UPI000C883BA8|nr:MULTISPECIES: hypothetical protein [unclassified Pseudomonas]PNA02878.1 hypothetical protein C1X79_00475 [Pseudomonas sp. FW305-42]PNA27608.1 hypothetical protein C1X78_02220 [Pseudomonas sp. MPR-R1B]PNB29674.1 hypothetical protein C1X80_00945 [Pseudomonas sp. DP16D-E2]PNB45230.1 hypothetical protein C1X75_02860 [Pseudomonas sp. FW305-17]PNB63599.1 hypothetical protein C1X77_06235 [Pseudomonas sp. GW531-E2]
MTVGLSVFRDDGGWQLTSQVRTSMLSFRTTYSGPFTAMTSPLAGTSYYFDVAIPEPTRSVFFNSATAMSIIFEARTGNVWRFRVSTPAPVEIFGFSEQVPASSRSGFQLFDEQGALAFDSDSQLLRIVDVVPNAAIGTRRPWPTAARRYAAGIGHSPKQMTPASLGGVPWMILRGTGVMLGPQTGVVEGWLVTGPTAGEMISPSPKMPAPTLMIIDVTGY